MCRILRLLSLKSCAFKAQYIAGYYLQIIVIYRLFLKSLAESGQASFQPPDFAGSEKISL